MSASASAGGDQHPPEEQQETGSQGEGGGVVERGGKREWGSSGSSGKPVRVVSCFDSFKGSLSSEEAAEAVERAFVAVYGSDAVVHTQISMSDGGEGFVKSLEGPLALSMVSLEVTGPRGTPKQAVYGVNKERSLAVFEVAQASGLEWLTEEEKDPRVTTTAGLGEQLAHARDQGYTEFIIGLGGSATNDAALGALHRLGLRVKLRSTGQWLAHGDNDVYVTGSMLGDICALEVVDTETKDNEEEEDGDTQAGDGSVEDKRVSLVPGTAVTIACDVNNPFTGPNGAVEIYSRQKGATEASVREELEAGMLNVQELLSRDYGVDLGELPGSGAAGGAAGGLHVFLKGNLVSGSDIMARATGLEEAIAGADVVFTGEGSYDQQTASGKVVSAVERLCVRFGVPMVVVAGVCKRELEEGQGEDDGRAKTVLALVDHFEVDKCMAEAGVCVEAVVRGWLEQ